MRASVQGAPWLHASPVNAGRRRRHARLFLAARSATAVPVTAAAFSLRTCEDAALTRATLVTRSSIQGDCVLCPLRPTRLSSTSALLLKT